MGSGQERHDFNRRAYERFTSWIQKRKHEKALRTIIRHPGLVSYMTLDEIPVYYSALRDNLGSAKAETFRIAVQGQFESIEEQWRLDRGLAR